MGGGSEVRGEFSTRLVPKHVGRRVSERVESAATRGDVVVTVGGERPRGGMARSVCSAVPGFYSGGRN